MHGYHDKMKLLDELKSFLAEKGGEDMRGMSMEDEDEDEMEGPGMGEEKPALAIAIEAPKPPSPGGDMDVDALIAKGMSSPDPTVKAMAEALMKAKKPGGM